MSAWPWDVLAAGCVLLAALRWYGLRRWAAKTRAVQARLCVLRQDMAVPRFYPDALHGLPAPVARYLRQVLPAGAVQVRSVTLSQQGVLNLRQSGECWRPFSARQTVVLQRPGFVWDARVSLLPLLTVCVHDGYVAGEGLLEPALLGLFALGAPCDRSKLAHDELTRFLAEAPWYPHVLLPGQGVKWQAIDGTSALATLCDGEVVVSLTFHFGRDGLVEAVRAEQRGRLVGGRLVSTPWEGRLSNYQRQDGVLVPLDGEVAWLMPQGRHPYWRSTMTMLAYQRQADGDPSGWGGKSTERRGLNVKTPGR
ncbi:DUF6920 family protein [Crenobacter intestini]|uniref:Uncharacterized protein n=1 Tax=Crenobacter intestini TaxID=2563443 RepID=A0A4T0USY1_9NEIS|nr:DUF6544 family protein [Crenobacter intestini]TIC82069.1 hypothetical protein E5K04_09935 [Crenobacter intestini]